MEPEIKLENLDINVDDVIEGASKLVSNGGIPGRIPVIDSKTGLLVVGAVCVGAVGATVVSKYVLPKVQNKLPEPGVLHRRNEVVDVDEDEIEEVGKKGKGKKKKPSKKEEAEEEEK